MLGMLLPSQMSVPKPEGVQPVQKLQRPQPQEAEEGGPALRGSVSKFILIYVCASQDGPALSGFVSKFLLIYVCPLPGECVGESLLGA